MVEHQLEEWEKESILDKNEVAEIKNNTLTENENSFIMAMSNNVSAVNMAKEAYQDIPNQEKIAKKIKRVAIDNTNADIEKVEVEVFGKNVDNKVKRQQLKNDLLKLHKEKKFIRREQNHKLKMQMMEQRKEKYGELLTRHNKIKKDENGNVKINLPIGFVLFFLIVFDAVVQFLNMIGEVLGKLNKTFLKGFVIFLILLFVFVSPFRNWIFNLIGINWGNN